MMFGVLIFLTYLFCGSIGAPSQADTAIGSDQLTYSSRIYRHPYILHNYKPKSKQSYRGNDYDDYSGRFTELQSPVHVLHAPKATTDDGETVPLKVHEPREDPKLFYQSNTYLKEIIGRNINQEVASIYPGRQFIRADEKYRVPKHLLRSHEENRLYTPAQKRCIQCPRDRTLIAKAGADRVILQNPSLKTCSTHKAPANVHFIHMYGPKFGTLLEQGSHVILGRLTYKNETLQICKMQVHVILQTCPTPKYLISDCEDNLCNFTCRNENSELKGESTLFCGEDMKWEGHLPVCRARNWCAPISLTDRGQISCRGETVGSNVGLAEGSRCRIRCPVGWRWNQKAVTVCRRGTWTNQLECIPKN